MELNFDLDQLPPRAGVEVEVLPGKVRFVAYRVGRWTNRVKKRSLPSGWFLILPDESIQLRWNAFEWPA